MYDKKDNFCSEQGLALLKINFLSIKKLISLTNGRVYNNIRIKKPKIQKIFFPIITL